MKKNYMDAGYSNPSPTIAKEIGECSKCNYPLYEGIHHDCPTAPRKNGEIKNNFLKI